VQHSPVCSYCVAFAATFSFFVFFLNAWVALWTRSLFSLKVASLFYFFLSQKIYLHFLALFTCMTGKCLL